MDAVITYVNGLDPLWQEDYARSIGGEPALAKRFRDWGTLPFLIRGIDQFMPFVRNIYLVVARESQVPQWASPRLRVVLHRDIIPPEFLPTFNSTSIEMFLHRIPGLDERYIYFNDDFYPVAPCAEADFFADGKCVKGFTRHLLALDQYKKQTRNADRLARKAAGRKMLPFFVRPQHICSPMLKSVSEEVFRLLEPELLARVTPLREDRNVNQYLFQDYALFTGRAVNRRLSNRHFSLAAHSIGKICNFLEQPSTGMVCINDVQMPQEKFLSCRDRLLATFENILPEKSPYEK